MNAARDSHEQKDEAFSLPDDNLGSSNWEAADLGEDKSNEELGVLISAKYG
ncbi:Hypothetical predicted protein [Lynx pardinus]|uniref:Uncharacterized protein n=1 Tax=Lynx pardinus TaxID=191816 RepID=A0A485P5H5_LYNPA|nr:Hypothetical predicted protein [Lynx pardinus]